MVNKDYLGDKNMNNAKYLVLLLTIFFLISCGQSTILVKEDTPAYRDQFQKSLEEFSKYYKKIASTQDDIRYELIRIDNKCSIARPLCIYSPQLPTKSPNNNLHICLDRDECSKLPKEKKFEVFKDDPNKAVEPAIARIRGFSEYLEALSSAMADDKNDAITQINILIDTYKKSIENYCKFAKNTSECKNPSSSSSFSSNSDYNAESARAIVTLLVVLEELKNTNLEAKKIRDILNKNNKKIADFLDDTHAEIENLESNLVSGQYATIKALVYFGTERQMTTMKGDERVEAAKRYNDLEQKQQIAQSGNAEVLKIVNSMKETHNNILKLANGNLNEDQRRRAVQAAFQNFQKVIVSTASVLGRLVG